MDNDLIQGYLDKGGVVRIPAGTYAIDGDKPLRAVSGSSIYLDGVTFQCSDQGGSYEMLYLKDVEHVSVYSGTFIGDSPHHKGGPTDHGFGIRIGTGAKGILLSGIRVTSCWADGFYIGGGEGIQIIGCVSTGNRRQGLSIVAGRDITVEKSSFLNTKGVPPQDGIDIEPDKGDVIEGCRITGCTFSGNAGACIELAPKRGKVSKLAISGNKYSGGCPIKGIPVNFLADVLGALKVWSLWPTSYSS